jgi:hypothetical protein
MPRRLRRPPRRVRRPRDPARWVLSYRSVAHAPCRKAWATEGDQDAAAIEPRHREDRGDEDAGMTRWRLSDEPASSAAPERASACHLFRKWSCCQHGSAGSIISRISFDAHRPRAWSGYGRKPAAQATRSARLLITRSRLRQLGLFTEF